LDLVRTSHHPPVLADDVALAPPVAPRIPHTEMRHGATVTDNYFWLRERSNPEVAKYLEAENAYNAAMTKDLKPFEDALYTEMLGRIKQTDLSVPVRQGEYLYYSRTEEGKQYPIQCRRKGSMDAPEEVLLDLNQLGKDHKFVGLGAFQVSDDQHLLAYTIDYVGFRQYSLHVKDLRTGETLPDTAERVTTVRWAADNKTLFFTTEDAVTKRSDKLWRHVPGATNPEPLYEEKDELYDIGLDKTRDKQYLLVESESKDTTEFRYLKADHPQDAFAVFLAREKKHRYYVDHREGLFYVRTNKGGKNFEIVTAPESDPSPKNWAVFLAQRDDVLIEDIDLFKTFAVSVEKSQALTQIRLYNFQTRAWTPIAFPEPVYSAFAGGTRDYESTTYRYNYQSFWFRF
jgi:oligopeptidase B